MKKNCIYCLEEFEAQRSTAAFCSDKCRMRSKRGVSATAGMSPEQISAYKKKEMLLNVQDLPTIQDGVFDDIQVDAETGEIMEIVDDVPSSSEIKGQEVIMEVVDEGPTCVIPTKEEYEQAIRDIEEYESHYPITNKEHAKALGITSTQCMCSFCGERYGSMQGRCPLYCKYCKSADQRKKVSKARNAVRTIQKYKDHHKEFPLYECPICNVKI